MKVFKFGGGVLKGHNDLEQLINILNRYKNEQLIVVVSAFNKVTNKFENLLNDFIENKELNISAFEEIKNYHYKFAQEITNGNSKNLLNHIDLIFEDIQKIFSNRLSDNYHFEYDKIVSFGEILSSVIIYDSLKNNGFRVKFEDIRNLILTDSVFTEAKVNWEVSVKRIKETCLKDDYNIIVTQGFIAADDKGYTTTLGREGSDFTAAIIGYAVDAEEVVFWKEVDGVYNADPTITNEFELLPKLSYKESVEQAFYGAKILHPKTIKPLQNKSIPINVRSFSKLEKNGTDIIDISEMSPEVYPNIPIYIVKENQILISLSTIDFSFISEDNLGKIFYLLSKNRIKVNLMQSSAISFSVCVSNDKYKIPELLNTLKEEFNVRYNDNLSLITIRHYNNDSVNKMIENKKVLLRQNSRHTIRFVVK